LRDVVDALNSVTGDETWSYVATGSIGQDAIKVGLLFKPAAVAAMGRFALLDHAVDARFDDALSRPALAQSFRIDNSEVLLTMVVTHLKSKRCSGAGGADADQHDGQACFNRTRTEAAAALADWALPDPTGSGAEYVLVLGDFNSHRMEDPIRVMREKGFVDLLGRFNETNSYTYVYDGLIGTLDYAFSNSALAAHVTGITAWHINADESPALDYRDEPGKPKEYHAANAFRSSDHDPLIIGLDIGAVQVQVQAQAQAGKIMPDKDSPKILYVLLAGALVLLAGVRMMRNNRPATMAKPKPVP
jgi:predicted extracellular nuclease